MTLKDYIIGLMYTDDVHFSDSATQMNAIYQTSNATTVGLDDCVVHVDAYMQPS